MKQAGKDGSALALRVNYVLKVILCVFIVIALRIAYLTVVDHERQVERSRAPQVRRVIHKAERGTIRDRFNIPLAVNKIRYDAAVLYSEIRELPRVKWVTDTEGSKQKTYPRLEHIEALARLLAEELQMPHEDIEDLIHGRAALFHQVPYVIKEDISEETYFRLKLLQKDWAGLHPERGSKRVYPQGRLAADVVGYLGAISREEYDAILDEMRHLRRYLSLVERGEMPEPLPDLHSYNEVRERLEDLEDRAYAATDSVGKAGIEARFEEELRGYRGFSRYYSDALGNYLRELPGGRSAIPGQRILLSISSELQAYAEQILVEQEEIRAGTCRKFNRKTGAYETLRDPWIRGGAIVAMDPHSGELVTIASYPRFDPNDFVVDGQQEEEQQRRMRLRRWLENDGYLAAIWDGKQALSRERYSATRGFWDEDSWLDWNTYLKTLFPEDNPIHRRLHEFDSLEAFVRFIQSFDALLEISGLEPAQFLEHFAQTPDAFEGDDVSRVTHWLRGIEKPQDQLLLVDLCRTAVDEQRFSERLIGYVGHMRIGEYRSHNQCMAHLDSVVKMKMRQLFHDVDFRLWRTERGRAYLRRKRQEEQDADTYARPYLDYYQRMERQMFADFWETNRFALLSYFLLGHPRVEEYENLRAYTAYLGTLRDELLQGAHQGELWYEDYRSFAAALSTMRLEPALAYMQTMRSYEDLTRPLYGRYHYLRKPRQGPQLEKHLAAAFYPVYGFGCMRAQAYRQSTPLGSTFKLITAYAALRQEWQEQIAKGEIPSQISLFEMIDERRAGPGGRGGILGRSLSGEPYPRLYKGGRLVQSLSRNIGRVNLERALEMSSNPYFSILAGDYLDEPEDLNRAAADFGFGTRTGIELPGELAGSLPKDLGSNRSGLYAMAIGQHSLVVTPLQTAVAMSALVNGGKVLVPKLIRLSAGKLPVRHASELMDKESYLYQKSLAALGVHFPLFSAAEDDTDMQQVLPYPTQVSSEIAMDPAIQVPLYNGMTRSMRHARDAGRPGLMRAYRSAPAAVRTLLNLEGKLIGKTSTAEAVERVDLDSKHGAEIYNHIWASCVSYAPEEEQAHQNLLVVRDEQGVPELVVIVYLRYGGYGKHAAPIVAQIVEKWREIQKRHGV